MATDILQTSNGVQKTSKELDTKVAVNSESKTEKTAKKINYWALFGLIFLTLGIITTTIATCGLNQIVFHAAIATLDTILGIGAISLSIGAVSITKALIDRRSSLIDKSTLIDRRSSLIDKSTLIDKRIIIFNPKRYGLVGIANKKNTCWLNSLMQMLLNIPDLKKTLKLNLHFKEFIDNYEKAIKEKHQVDVLALKDFLKTICPDITDESSFHDSHEVLSAILNLFKAYNINLQNTLIVKNHFLHQNASKSVSEQRLEHEGLIELPPPMKNPKSDTLYKRLIEYFISEQDFEVKDTVSSTKKETYFFGLFQKDVTEKVVIDKKKCFLEERKFRVAPNDLFLNIQRYQYDSKIKDTIRMDNDVDIPAKLELEKKYIENNQGSSYELSSFIRHVNSHYVCYVKKGDLWFKCDDNKVKKISLNKALKASKKAYLVHYKKLR